MKIWNILCGLRRAIERELKLIAAFAPLPSDIQYEIDLESWPSSRTDEAASAERSSGSAEFPARVRDIPETLGR